MKEFPLNKQNQSCWGEVLPHKEKWCKILLMILKNKFRILQCQWGNFVNMGISRIAFDLNLDSEVLWMFWQCVSVGEKLWQMQHRGQLLHQKETRLTLICTQKPFYLAEFHHFLYYEHTQSLMNPNLSCGYVALSIQYIYGPHCKSHPFYIALF